MDTTFMISKKECIIIITLLLIITFTLATHIAKHYIYDYENSLHTVVTDDFFKDIIDEYYRLYLHKKLLYIQRIRFFGEILLTENDDIIKIASKYFPNGDDPPFTRFSFAGNGQLLTKPNISYGCLGDNENAILSQSIFNYIKNRQKSFSTTWITINIPTSCSIYYFTAARYDTTSNSYLCEGIELTFLQKHEEALLNALENDIITTLERFDLYVTITNRAWDIIYNKNINISVVDLGKVLQDLKRLKYYERKMIQLNNQTGTYWHFEPLNWDIIVWE